MCVKMLHRFLLSFARSGGAGEPAPNVVYSEPIVMGEHFVIKACGGSYGGEIGRVVAEPLAPADCCYVMDVLIDPEHRRRGIALELLSRALQYSGCSTLVPVSIEREAIRFWSHLAVNGKVPVSGYRQLRCPVARQL
ncbi:GNAT family N-acetyltransferase [Paraburkholderia sp. BCC1885]|uniref:GNAT family N-acetyltransferase n=1 Tax=Paraburkholderia sp. BCC1885 TaxID=2562669 RepID=UPI0011824060